MNADPIPEATIPPVATLVKESVDPFHPSPYESMRFTAKHVLVVGEELVRYVPAGQIVHKLEPVEAAYAPEGQTAQMLEAVAPNAVLKVPALHSVQSESVL